MDNPTPQTSPPAPPPPPSPPPRNRPDWLAKSIRDVVILIFGILLSLWINGWTEDRRDVVRTNANLSRL